MQMINVMKRLAELDSTNPNVAKDTTKVKLKADAAVEAVQQSLSEELSVESLRYLSGVKRTLDECGMYPEGMSMAPSMPSTPASFSINATAADGDEVANMLAQIMTLAGGSKVGPEHMPIDKEPNVMTTLPSLSQSNQAGNDQMKRMIDVMNEPGDAGPVDSDGKPEDEGLLGTMAGAGIGAVVGGPLGAAVGGAAGDSITDSSPEDEGLGAIPEVDIAGVGGGLAAAAMSDGDTDEIAAGVEAGKEFTGDSQGGEMEAKDHIRKMMDMLDNSPNNPTDIPAHDPDKFAYNPNGGSMGIGDRMDGNMPKGNMTAEDAMTSQLFNDYEKFVTEGLMQEASNAFTQTAPYPSFKKKKPASHQEKTTMKHVKNPTAGEKAAAKDIKPGTAGYKDRIDMLKSAEKDGRLKSN